MRVGEKDGCIICIPVDPGCLKLPCGLTTGGILAKGYKPRAIHQRVPDERHATIGLILASYQEKFADFWMPVKLYRGMK